MAEKIKKTKIIKEFIKYILTITFLPLAILILILTRLLGFKSQLNHFKFYWFGRLILIRNKDTDVIIEKYKQYSGNSKMMHKKQYELKNILLHERENNGRK